jgi:hypothetical protein
MGGPLECGFVHRSDMKSSLSFIVVFALLSLAAFGAEPKKGPAEKPPAAINLHFKWCGLPMAASDQLRRYEGFWAQRHPKDEEYEDGVQIRYVRQCAYRLAALYAGTGNTKKCQEMIKWLEKTDDSLKVE